MHRLVSIVSHPALQLSRQPFPRQTYIRCADRGATLPTRYPIVRVSGVMVLCLRAATTDCELRGCGLKLIAIGIIADHELFISYRRKLCHKQALALQVRKRCTTCEVTLHVLRVPARGRYNVTNLSHHCHTHWPALAAMWRLQQWSMLLGATLHV